MKMLSKIKWFLWMFGTFKVPLIGTVGPKIISLDDSTIVIRLPFKRRNKNHLKSMYFGALAVGADVAGGLQTVYFADQMNLKVSFAFKSFQAQFLKRPEADVYFICKEGKKVKHLLERAKSEKVRLNEPVSIEAYTGYPKQPELVATFVLELSVKVIG